MSCMVILRNRTEKNLTIRTVSYRCHKKKEGKRDRKRQKKRNIERPRALTNYETDRNSASRSMLSFFNERQWGVERLAHLQYRRMQVQVRVQVQQERNFSLLFSSPPPPAMQLVPVLASVYAPPPA